MQFETIIIIQKIFLMKHENKYLHKILQSTSKKYLFEILPVILNAFKNKIERNIFFGVLVNFYTHYKRIKRDMMM